jgi:O-antigen/teichoic acid export membrane protein
MNVARHIGANMATAVVGKSVTAIAGVAGVAIIARHLGTHDYGILRTALTFVAFAGTFANLGLNYIMLREVAKNEAASARIIGVSLGLRLAVTTLVLALGVGVAYLMPWNHVILAAIAIAGIGVIAYQGNELITCVLQWRLRQGRAMLAEAVGAMLALVAAAVAAFVGSGVLVMTATTSLGLVVAFILAWLFAARLTSVRPRIDITASRHLVGLGLPVAISACFTLITLRSDTLLLSLFKSPAEVGLYGIATKIYEVGLQLPVLMGGLLMPLFARAAGQPQQLREQIGHALHALTIVGIAIVLALGFFAEDIVVLLAGPAFAAGAPAVRIAGVSLALAGFSAVLRYAAVAQEQQARLMRVDGIVMLIAVAAYLLLIPRYSFIGAALGTLLAEIASIAGSWWVVGRNIGGVPIPRFAVRALLAGSLAGAALVLLRTGPLPLLVDALLGATAYLVLLLITGGLKAGLVKDLLVPQSRH